MTHHIRTPETELPISERPRQEWRTPPDLIDAIRATFGPIALDAAANGANTVGADYLGPSHQNPKQRDALAADWSKAAGPDGLVFVNPPFSLMGAFMAKAVASRVPVVALGRAALSTRWAVKLHANGWAIVAFEKRINYLPPIGSAIPPYNAPFDSALFVSLGAQARAARYRGWSMSRFCYATQNNLEQGRTS